MDTQQSTATVEIMQRFNDVFQHHDPSGLAALVAEHCVIENTRSPPRTARAMSAAMHASRYGAA